MLIILHRILRDGFMIFRNFEDRLLGSKIKVKLLMMLFSEDTSVSEREMARRLGFSHMSVNRAFKDFYDINLVVPIKIGNATLWKLNKESYAYDLLTRNNFIKALATDSPIQNLKSRLQLGSVPHIKRIVLYGSVAEGKEERTSDIDIAVFISSKDEKIKKDIRNKLEEISEQCIKLYGNPLHPYILTDEEFSRMGKEFKKRIENGIVVFSNELETM